MARNILSNITARGTKAAFAERMKTFPGIWEQFVQRIPSDAPDETHVWLGAVPNPREYISGRNLVGIRDFTYNIENEEFELSWIVDRNSMEDDRHGLVNQRTAQAADVWAKYKDVQLAALCNNGGSAGYTSYDGVTFFNDTHVIGAAATASIDNNLASATPADPEALTAAEMAVEFRTLMLFLQGAQDDTGGEGYNWGSALSKILVMGNQQFERALKESINAALISTGGSNPYMENIADVVINPFLGVTNDYLYAAAVGDPDRMPFIYQERTPLEIEVFDDPKNVALNHGTLVLCRQRYRLWYGEPRRMVFTALT